ESVRDIPVATAMSREVLHCWPDDTLLSAQTLMRRHQVRRLPVLDDDRKVIGILSINDLARASNGDGETDAVASSAGIARAEVAATLAAISRPRRRSASAPARRPALQRGT